MLITPAELKGHSSFDAVKGRPDQQLSQDILEAQVEIEEFVGHDFSDPVYTPFPEKAKVALLKMAQYFALINSDESIVKGYKSEKIGDYSYTLGDGTVLRKPDVYSLLKGFIIEPETPVSIESIKFRMRSI